MTLRAIVVDDEPLAREELRFLLQQCDGIDVVGETGFPFEAERLCEDTEPQIAFIDLRMPGLDGIALTALLRRNHPELAVVIVSAHDDGALRGFEAQVTDYLLKPVRLERLRQTVERISGASPGSVQSPRGLERFAARRRSTYVVIDVRDVVYFEARGEFVWAVTEVDRFAIDRTLTNLVDLLDNRVFFQSHRSCIVRLDRIRTIEPTGARSFLLRLDHPDDPTAPLARDRASKLRERIPFLR